MYIKLQCYICIFYLNINFIFSHNILDKYKSINITCNENEFIIFNSSDFKIPSTLYFKISTFSSFDKDILYEFNETNIINNYNNDHSFKLRYMRTPSKESKENNNNEEITIRYYNIEKDKTHISEADGNKLILQLLNCRGILNIENIKEDVTSKKLSTGVIIGIILGCVGAIALVITIFCCYAKYLEKKNKRGDDKRKPKTQRYYSSLKIKKLNENHRRKKNTMNPIVHNSHRLHRNLTNGKGPESFDSTYHIKGGKK